MHTQTLPYHPHTADLFEHFAYLPYAIFLDSCRPQQHQGRYDIIVADPVDMIESDSAVFKGIDEKLTKFKNSILLPEKHSALPFTVGALGYLTYDIGRSLEKIPTIAQDDIALPKAVVGIYAWSIVVDHHQKKTVFTSAFSSDHPATQRILNLLQEKPGVEKHFALTQSFESNMSRDTYSAAFHLIKKNILAGNCYQVNLAQRFSARFTGSPWQAYLLLRQKNPAPYSAFMHLPTGAILSTSPEQFIKVDQDHVETKPIKGTSPRFPDPAHDQQSALDLCSSEKDRAENVMIVDLLRNDLSRACVAGSVQVPTLCALESFSNVHHLVSTITGQLREGATSLHLFQHCFPGGSITGAPKIAAMKIIESLEPHRRSLYCGSIFYLDIHDHFDSNIAIRTVICDNHRMHCYAGGGIVFDSDCEAEYQETLVKVSKIIRTLEER